MTFHYDLHEIPLPSQSQLLHNNESISISESTSTPFNESLKTSTKEGDNTTIIQQINQELNNSTYDHSEDSIVPISTTNSSLVLLTNETQSADSHQNRSGLDFIIAAFPKSATSILQIVLQEHNEIQMLRKTSTLKDGTNKLEEYVLQNKEKVKELFEHIEQMRSTTPDGDGHDVKLGIKWPRAIVGNYIQFMNHMREMNPGGKDPKLIIGMRHPIRWFESRYNFNHRIGRDVPSLSSLINIDQDDDLILQSFIDITQYEKHIKQLGLVDLDPEDLERIGENYIRTNNEVFFYLQEQLEDEAVAETLFEELRTFLDLHTPIYDKELLAEGVYPKKTIFDICSADFANLRKLLNTNGNRTATWIKEKLMHGEGVIIGGKTGFSRLIEKWGKDPCE